MSEDLQSGETLRVRSDVVDGVAVLTLDNPPINAGSTEVRRQLLAAVEAFSERPDIVGMVIIGRGKTFMAGSDLREFGKPLEDPQLPAVIAAIEASPKPVVAALHGAALGGGLELALGCDRRIAASGSLVGLPEVTLGMIPGAGGTQRLSRLTGLPKAIELICAGTRLPAAEALALGIVDELCEGDLLAAAVALAKRATKRRIVDLAAPPADEAAVDAAKESALTKGRRRPAVVAAIEAVLDARRLPVGQALRREREAFQRLRMSREAAALRYQFFAERAAGQRPELDGVKPRPLGRIGIIGAGTMGSGIAVACLDAGYEVTLLEQSADYLAKGEALLRDLYRRQRASGRMTEQAVEQALGRLTPALDDHALTACDLVIEAVFEDLEVKRTLLARLSAVMAPRAIVATNTSYLDVDAIAASYAWPSNVCGLHFFSPANIMKLLEIVRGAATAADVMATGLAFGRRLAKIPVIAGNSFGFIGNRLYAAYRRQAEFLVEEGASPTQVDAAMESFGFAMGPFAVADLSGLDIAWRMRKAQAAARDARRRYVAIPDLLCEAGRLGRKTGAGYYTYASGRKETDPEEVEALIRNYRVQRGVAAKDFGVEEIQRRLLLTLANEAALALAEGVASRAEDIDVVLVNGYGFPRWQGGPVFWARHEDPERMRQELASLERISGEGFMLGDMSRLGRDI